MRIDDAYRLLDVTPAASPEELKAAHRDLTKVWHPDRFVNDPPMQQKAGERLKAINEAYETIRAARAGRGRAWSDGSHKTQPPPPAGVPQQAQRRLLAWTFTCVALGFLILIRRPTFGGLIVAALLFGVAGILTWKIRKSNRQAP